MRSYIGFTESEAAILTVLLHRHDRTSPALPTSSTPSSGSTPARSRSSKDEAQARRLHASLQVWLGELLGGTVRRGLRRPACAHRSCARAGRASTALHRHGDRAASARLAPAHRIPSFSWSTLPRDTTERAIARICDSDLGAPCPRASRKDLVSRLDRARANARDAAIRSTARRPQSRLLRGRVSRPPTSCSLGLRPQGTAGGGQPQGRAAHGVHAGRPVRRWTSSRSSSRSARPP